jgi:hypothetical protein
VAALRRPAPRTGQDGRDVGKSPCMKLLLEIGVAAILHPLAVILLWINLASRTDLDAAKKIIWALVGLIWGIGPILYVTVGDGKLW